MAGNIITVSGETDIKQLIDRLPAIVRQGVIDAVNEFAINVQSQAKRNITDLPAVDTGRLRSSIMVEIGDDGISRRVGSDVNYAAAIEFGSKPHFPPLDPIREWCRRHNIPETAAYAIALKISKYGQPAKPYLHPAFEEWRPKFEGMIKRAFADLRRELP
jgi:phage gpG-like protein